jgi:transcriptional regulator with XRE-family HTH domain
VPVESGVMRQLIRLRQKRKIKASEVARRMGVARQQIYNLETMRQGYPSIQTLERYAKAVGAKIAVLIDDI